MKVLVVGATGKYASLVVPELKQRGATVRALVRDESKIAVAQQQGADETAIGDLSDPDSLLTAAAGVDGVFHINPAFAPHEAELGVAMVEAAKASGVQKFVFSGVYHPSISKLSNHAAKRPVEEAMYESGMDFTVLQPAMFMQNFAAGWDVVIQQGRFSLPYSNLAKACYVDYRDVAEVAAITLIGDALSYGTFELSASGMVNRVELVAIMSAAIGCPIKAGESPFDEWAQAAQIPDELRENLRVMYEDYDQYGFPGGNAIVLQTILEREPRSLQQYFQELVSSKVTDGCSIKV